MLLPAQVAAAVPRAEQDVALGLCSAIGSATQLIQPPVGALSDRQGRRRPWMLLGQFLCAAGCIALLLARGTWQLTAAFTTFMLGASISWGAYMCIVPEYVPPSQHGAASGMLGLMVQGGGLTAAGSKKKVKKPIVNESTNGLLNTRGTVAMARTNDPNSATSQFFVNHVDNVFLNYASDAKPGYAVFGEVVSGMDVVDAIAEVKVGAGDVPVEPVIIKDVIR